MNRQILVVGGAGYIGSHVVKALLENGDNPVVFDDFSTGKMENLPQTVKVIRGSILDREALKTALEGMDGVAFLAAKKAVGESQQDPNKYAENNLNGMTNVLMAMNDMGVDKLVIASSAAVYGQGEGRPVVETDKLDPCNFYGYTKVAMEQLSDWYGRLGRIKTVSLRFFNAAGYAADGSITGMEVAPQNLLPIVFEAAYGIRPEMTIFGRDYDTRDGTCIRDYINVEDLADAHVKAFDYLQQDDSERFLALNLGTGKGVSVTEMVETVEQTTGLTVPHKYGPRRDGDPAFLTADPSLAEKKLGWKATRSSPTQLVSSMDRIYKIHFGDRLNGRGSRC